MKRCHCGSYAFNLYKEDIDQGDLCDVHYWKEKALAQPEQEPVLVECGNCHEGLADMEHVCKKCLGAGWVNNPQPKEPKHETVIKTVWVVGGKTWQQICATQEDAHKLIADMGMNTPSLYPSMSEVPLLSYTTPPQRKPLVIDSDEKATQHMNEKLFEFLDIAMMFPKAKADLSVWERVIIFAPQRKTLTDEQIVPMFRAREKLKALGEKDAWFWYAWGIGDAEAAHGIKGQS
ncbi:hypothetical protein [Polynucleobacter sp. UK-Kesae-W10]|uniref:hypothetical protein n=1 Tax=Polynucleobacter sp. UK-Kesae-W10 TaxID=1819738 RepID=UPI001C0CE1D3|nr:hypothetical protein [Polynucleobacter sp. UK-Kesae-W10]MBU3577555.1 hypothetical protein [Polynucleobacter sp. UK-Kesae-W10]